MTHTIWNDLYQQPTLAVSSDKYTKLVHDSTSQLDGPLQSILSSLDRRAMAFTKLASYDAALSDAKLIQQLSPSEALGYIREADIYSGQGKQRQVIDICNKGLNMVNTMDTRYDTLQRMKADAEQRQNTRVDFISQLPNDIVITMLIPLFTHYHYWRPLTPWPYLYVSHQWSERIIQSLKGLRFKTGYDDTKYVKKDPQMTIFARHVKELHIGRFSQGTWLCDLLRKNDFCSLQDLIINFGADCVHGLISSLKSISSTLTQIRIVRQSGAMLPIGHILLNCPNLVSLWLSLDSVDYLTSLPMMTCTTLTKLSIFISKRELTSADFMAIGRRLPSLMDLRFNTCSDVQSMRVLLDYYPWMNCLTVYGSGGGSQIHLLHEGPMREGTGITHLAIMVSSLDHPLWENMVYILRQCHMTVERLRFEVELDSEQEEELYNLEFRRLKKAHLDGSGWWIPRHAPMIEELMISPITINANPSVLDVVPVNLMALHLDVVETDNVDQKALIERYLLRFTNHPNLKELAVNFHTTNNADNLYNAILHLRHLQHLKISVMYDWDSNQMQRFLDLLVKRCPNLAGLEISCRNAPSIDSIHALKQLDHLEKLAFSGFNTEGDHDFWYAVQSLPKLKWLRFCWKSPDTMHDIGRLKGQRPDLKIDSGDGDFLSFY